MLFPGQPRTSWAVPVPFREPRAPRGFSNHSPQGREAPSCETSRPVHSTETAPSRGRVPCTGWAALAENLQCQSVQVTTSSWLMPHFPIGNSIPGVGVVEQTQTTAAEHLEDGRREAQSQVCVDTSEGCGYCQRDVWQKGKEEKYLIFLSLCVWKWALPTAITAPAKQESPLPWHQNKLSGHPPQGTVCFRFPVLKSEFKKEKPLDFILTKPERFF